MTAIRGLQSNIASDSQNAAEELASLKGGYDGLKAENAALKAEIENLKDQINKSKELDEELANIKSKYSALKTNTESMANLIKKAYAEKKDAIMMIAKLQTELDQVKNQKSDNTNVEVLELQMAEMQNALAVSEQRFVDLMSNLNAESQRAEALEKSLGQTSALLNTKDNEIQNYSARNALAASALRAVADVIASPTADAAAISSAVASVTSVPAPSLRMESADNQIVDDEDDDEVQSIKAVVVSLCSKAFVDYNTTGLVAKMKEYMDQINDAILKKFGGDSADNDARVAVVGTVDVDLMNTVVSINNAVVIAGDDEDTKKSVYHTTLANAYAVLTKTVEIVNGRATYKSV